MYVRVRIKGVRNASFLENFAYVLNEWSPFGRWQPENEPIIEKNPQPHKRFFACWNDNLN